MGTILVIGAHSDDQIFGPGGTIAKYAQQGHTIKTIIMSYGELSHFWLQEHYTIDMRIAESDHADKIIRGKGVTFFDLKEGKFLEESEEKEIVKKLSRMIKKEPPLKIFTHGEDDPHKDHRETLKLVLKSLDTLPFQIPVYTFNVWNLFNFKKDYPRMIIDISDTFSTKIRALKCFKSQKHAMLLLLWSVYARAFFHGIRNDMKWAEVFFRVR
jgi:LmbE family N-acetylglucosaminyl deacetylase